MCQPGGERADRREPRGRRHLRLQRLARGDVGVQAGDPRGPAVLVPFDRAAAIEEPTPGTVPRAHPHLHRVARRLTLDVRDERAARLREVVRVGDPHPVFGRGQLFACVAEHLPQLRVALEPAGAQIPVEHAVAGGLQRQLQAFAAGAKLPLRVQADQLGRGAHREDPQGLRIEVGRQRRRIRRGHQPDAVTFGPEHRDRGVAAHPTALGELLVEAVGVEADAVPQELFARRSAQRIFEVVQEPVAAPERERARTQLLRFEDARDEDVLAAEQRGDVPGERAEQIRSRPEGRVLERAEQPFCWCHDWIPHLRGTIGHRAGASVVARAQSDRDQP